MQHLDSKRQIFKQADEAEERGDIAAAIRLTSQLAVLEDVDAQFRLALLYDNHVRPHEPGKVIYWYMRAVRNGDSAAAWNLGSYYNSRKKKRWYRFWIAKAEAMGDEDAVIEMARIRSDERVEASGLSKENILHYEYELFIKAHEAEERGHLDTALRLFEQLARRGDGIAQNRLARLYDNLVQPRQPQKAIYWDIRAYRAGINSAAWNLAMHYVPRGNMRWYRFWMEKAEAMGNENSIIEMVKIRADSNYMTKLPLEDDHDDKDED